MDFWLDETGERQALRLWQREPVISLICQARESRKAPGDNIPLSLHYFASQDIGNKETLCLRRAFRVFPSGPLKVYVKDYFVPPSKRMSNCLYAITLSVGRKKIVSFFFSVHRLRFLMRAVT